MEILVGQQQGCTTCNRRELFGHKKFLCDVLRDLIIERKHDTGFVTALLNIITKRSIRVFEKSILSVP